MMDPNRQQWNQQQQELQHAMRQALAKPTDHQKTLSLFLSQHAMLHTAQMSQSGLYSFEDAVWQDLSDAAFRRIPKAGEHSIAWMVWHVTRIEDITMNLLVAGQQQIFNEGNWPQRLNVSVCDTGNAMNDEAVAALSATLDMAALREYRLLVGRRTREVVQGLTAQTFKQKVDPVRIQTMMAQGAVVQEAQWLADYWGGRTIAGLLLMPATRHIFVHWNEAMKVKKLK